MNNSILAIEQFYSNQQSFKLFITNSFKIRPDSYSGFVDSNS